MATGPLVSIVDDDAAAADAVAGLVRSLGFAAETFDSAEAFLASGAVARSACLIADVRMPAMTGPELFERLVAAGTPVPTILMSAHDDFNMARLNPHHDLCGFLAKPLNPDALLDCIGSAFARRPGGAGGPAAP